MTDMLGAAKRTWKYFIRGLMLQRPVEACAGAAHIKGLPAHGCAPVSARVVVQRGAREAASRVWLGLAWGVARGARTCLAVPEMHRAASDAPGGTHGRAMEPPVASWDQGLERVSRVDGEV